MLGQIKGPVGFHPAIARVRQARSRSQRRKVNVRRVVPRLAIHQIEGHIVVPNVMGGALRMHPLLVIFGLLAGFQIDGIPGALVALPLLAAARATWEFFAERLVLEPWQAGTIPVEVEPAESPEGPPARTLSL